MGRDSGLFLKYYPIRTTFFFVYLALEGNSRRNVKYKATNTLMPRRPFQFSCIRGTSTADGTRGALTYS
jgi:hypothetical protein